jgi:hypothetical protein
VRKLILALMLSVLLLGFGNAMAATSALDNLPGGAGFNYFHAAAGGQVTLFNVQNIDTTPVLVHITLYDSNSNHLWDFNVPLSGWDNWGCTISGDGTQILVSPQTPCFYAGPNNGCFAPMSLGLPADAQGFQKGYMSFVISAGDSVWYGGDGNGDPRNDPIATGANTRHYDVLFGRTALLNPVAGSAIALNSTMLQGFVNIFTAPGLVEANAADGWDSIADVNVPFYWNCDLDILDTFPSHDDPIQGLNIDSWEIMLTQWDQWAVIADDWNGGGVGETLYQAVGSGTMYVGRYNETPGLSETILISVFPANNTAAGLLPVPFSPACGYSSTNILAFCYDDNEFPGSTTVSSTEVSRTAFGPAVGQIHVPGTSGECRILVDAPLLGFTYTESGNYADVYPLMKSDQWINAADRFHPAFATWHGGVHADDPLQTEVIDIGVQENY